MVHVPGLEGRILSRPHVPSPQTFSEVCIPRTGLPVQGAALWPLSPRVFTRVVAAALSPLQAAGLKILPYLDDWLICAPDRVRVMKDTERVIYHVQSLGLRVNLEKSNLIPTQNTMFVGLQLNSVTMRGSLTPHRVSKLLVLVSQFRLGRRLELVQYQRLLGTISAAAAVVPLGLLRVECVQQTPP